MAQLKSLTIDGNPMADFILEQGTETNTITGIQYSSSSSSVLLHPAMLLGIGKSGIAVKLYVMGKL